MLFFKELMIQMQVKNPESAISSSFIPMAFGFRTNSQGLREFRHSSMADIFVVTFQYFKQVHMKYLKLRNTSKKPSSYESQTSMDMCITSEEDSDNVRESSPNFGCAKSDDIEETKDCISQDDKNRALQQFIEHLQITLDVLID